MKIAVGRVHAAIGTLGKKAKLRFMGKVAAGALLEPKSARMYGVQKSNQASKMKMLSPSIMKTNTTTTSLGISRDRKQVKLPKTFAQLELLVPGSFVLPEFQLSHGAFETVASSIIKEKSMRFYPLACLFPLVGIAEILWCQIRHVTLSVKMPTSYPMACATSSNLEG